MSSKKSITFLLMGDAGVGKSTLVDVYLRKLHFGLAYHDHRIDQQRYQIEVVEILSFDQLERHNTRVYENEEDVIINVLCFSVTDRKTLNTLKQVWIPEVMNLNKHSKMFLMGLQCDLREQFLTKLTQNCFSHEDGIQACLYYEKIYYVECSTMKLASVRDAFEKMLDIYFYEDIQKEMEARILKLYATMQIKFEFYGKVEMLAENVETTNAIDDTHPDEEIYGIYKAVDDPQPDEDIFAKVEIMHLIDDSHPDEEIFANAGTGDVIDDSHPDEEIFGIKVHSHSKVSQH